MFPTDCKDRDGKAKNKTTSPYQILVTRHFQASVVRRIAMLGEDGLTLDELLGALLKGYLQQTAEVRAHFTELFNTVDSDGSGFISLDEFHDILKRLNPDIKPGTKTTRMFRNALQYSSHPECLTPRSFEHLSENSSFISMAASSLECPLAPPSSSSSSSSSGNATKSGGPGTQPQRAIAGAQFVVGVPVPLGGVGEDNADSLSRLRRSWAMSAPAVRAHLGSLEHAGETRLHATCVAKLEAFERKLGEGGGGGVGRTGARYPPDAQECAQLRRQLIASLTLAMSEMQQRQERLAAAEARPSRRRSRSTPMAFDVGGGHGGSGDGGGGIRGMIQRVGGRNAEGADSSSRRSSSSSSSTEVATLRSKRRESLLAVTLGLGEMSGGVEVEGDF
jgi:hypothetical protein